MNEAYWASLDMSVVMSLYNFLGSHLRKGSNRQKFQITILYSDWPSYYKIMLTNTKSAQSDNAVVQKTATRLGS